MGRIPATTFVAPLSAGAGAASAQPNASSRPAGPWRGARDRHQVRRPKPVVHFTEQRTVSHGAVGRTVSLVMTGPAGFSDTAFVGDPVPNVLRRCSLMAPSGPTPSPSQFVPGRTVSWVMTVSRPL